MKHKGILNYCISISCVVFWFTTSLAAQNDSLTNSNNDLENITLKYGLRIGVDTGKLIRSFVDEDYTALELVGDYRLTEKLYIAGEIGNEEDNTLTDFLDTTTKGTYFKAGIDYNLYDNWLDMDNMIYFGTRAAFSAFNHSINEYTVYSTNQYWTQNNVTESAAKNNLTATWLELILGIKAELFPNLFMALNAQLKILISETVPDNFENIYIPGFNKTYDSTFIGVGYGYTLSYRIPFYKKNKKTPNAVE